MLTKFRLRMIERFGSQIATAKILGIEEGRLSKILHEHVKPTAGEREKIVAVFGRGVLMRPRPAVADAQPEHEAANG